VFVLVPSSLAMPLELLPTPSGNWYNAFYEYTFSCNGRLRAWEYYAFNNGTFFADVHRFMPNGKYTLVSKTRYLLCVLISMNVGTVKIANICLVKY